MTEAAVVGLERSADASRKSESPPATVEPSLREIYAVHARAAWRSLRRLGVHESELEDALQDVFLIVHRRLGDFEGRAALRTWIYGIVLRVAKDHRRAEARHVARVDGLARRLVSELDNHGDPALATERHQACQLMHALLAQLPDELREVLVLVELEELTVRETAALLGIRVRTCQRRLRAAGQAFDASLAAYLNCPGRLTP